MEAVSFKEQSQSNKRDRLDTDSTIATVDEYADIDDMIAPSKQLNIQVTESKYTDVTDEKNETRAKRDSINSFYSMTTFDRQKSVKSVMTVTTVDNMSNMEMSEIETYDSNIHNVRDLKRIISPTFESNVSKSTNATNPIRRGLTSRKVTDRTDMSAITELDEPLPFSSPESSEDIRIMEITFTVYSFDVLLENGQSIQDDWDIQPMETRINRLIKHFKKMKQNNMMRLMVVSNILATDTLKRKLRLMHLKKMFRDGDIVGYDHKVVKACNASIELMIMKLVRSLEIEPNELLFIGNKRSNVLQMKSSGICQVYQVGGKSPKRQRVLGSNDLLYLEGRVQDSLTSPMAMDAI